jgi:hypothetical protein
MVRFVPVMIVGLVAIGLLIGGRSPAWWITALVALGLFVVIWLTTGMRFAGRELHLAPYVPAALIGVVSIGLLLGGASPAWWITGLVAIGFALLYFMSTH